MFVSCCAKLRHKLGHIGSKSPTRWKGIEGVSLLEAASILISINWKLEPDKALNEKAELMDVSIPATLFRKIEDKIKGTRFNSVSAYVSYVLSERMAEIEKPAQEEQFTKDEEEAVKERLRALGYLG